MARWRWGRSSADRPTPAERLEAEWDAPGPRLNLPREVQKRVTEYATRNECSIVEALTALVLAGLAADGAGRAK